MDRAVTAALLCALVFPGTGQLYLKRRRRGWLFVLLTLAAVVYFVVQILGPVLAIADEISAGTVPLDPLAIAIRLEDHGHAASPLHSVAALVMLGCWIASTIDAWRLGRQGA